MLDKIMSVDDYTPCRKFELFLEEGEEIEITTAEGLFRLKGISRKIWLMSDGKHTIASITDQLCLEFNENKENSDKMKKQVIATLKRLKEMQVIIVNWDPLYKFSISQELI